MNMPSSTITAAALAGLGMTFFWGLVAFFTEVEINEALVSGLSAIVMAVVGYFKKETVLK